MLRNPIRTLAIATGAAVLVAVVAATSSEAAGVGVPGGGHPVMTAATPNTLPFPALPDPEGLCAFPVTVQDVDVNGTVKDYGDGYLKGTGRLITKITNEATGEYVLRNISGPGRIYVDSTGLVHFILDGASLTWVWQGMDATGTVDVGLYIRHGSVVYDGFTLVSYTGTAENLCETLG